MRNVVDLVDWIRIRRDINANPQVTVAELSETHNIQAAALSRHLRSLGIKLVYGKKQVRTPCIVHDPEKDVDYKFEVHRFAIDEVREYEFGTREHGRKLRLQAWSQTNCGRAAIMNVQIQTKIVGNKLTIKRIR